MPDEIELIIPSRERDLGGFSVHRVLPFSKHRMVGPFIFLDHMGPAEFPAGRGIEVRPHPHINLSTVTYLFEGIIRHRDSLGSDQLIEPGAINWMTAGRGIVHSERAPEEALAKTSRLNGIQCWVALPEEAEESEPSFAHHPAKSLPQFRRGDAELRLLLGTAFGKASPVKVHSDMFYLDAKLPAGARIDVPLEGREGAVYVADGEIRVGDRTVERLSMAVGHRDGHLPIEAVKDSRLMLLGGKPVGERFIFWNFVSSSKERIEEAKALWANGPGEGRFPKIPGDDREFVPLG